MAVEEDATAGIEVLQQWETGAELVNEEGFGRNVGQLGGEVDLEDQVQLSQNCAENAEAR